MSQPLYQARHVAGIPLLATEVVIASPSPSGATLVMPAHYSNSRDSELLTGGGDLPLGAWRVPAGATGEDVRARFAFLTARASHISPVPPDSGSPDVPGSPAVRRLARLVHEHGGQAVLVGGSVRDHLRGVPVTDFDVEVRGLEPDQLELLLRGEFGDVNLVGSSFAVYKVGRPPNVIDVSLPRAETKTGPGHADFQVHVDPHMPVRDAAARRDFTINAIGIDLHTAQLMDPFDGKTDLARGRLAHVGPRFAEDPLRVLRGAQLSARLGLVPDPDTIALCASLAGQRDQLSGERVFAELVKLSAANTPSLGVIFLRECGWLPPALQELEGMPGRDGLDALASTAALMDAAAAQVRAQVRAQGHVLGFAAMCALLPGSDTWQLCSGLNRQRGFATKVVDVVAAAWQLRSARGTDGGVPGHVLLAVADACGGVALPVTLLDAMDRAWPAGGGMRHSALLLTGQAQDAGVWDAAPPSLVAGLDVMGLGVPSSPRVGQVLQVIRSAQLAGRVRDRDEAVELLRTLV